MPPAAALSRYADSVSAPARTRRKTAPETESLKRDLAARRAYLERRRARYELRTRLQEVTGEKRLRACGCWPHTKGEGVDLHITDSGAAYYAGLQTCGSPWICPVCAAKIRQRHADDVAAAALSWISEGKALYSMMLTLPHDAEMSLEQTWKFVRGSFRALLSGRYWRKIKERFNLAGFVRSTEVTYGSHGWHPHIHVLAFCDRALTPAESRELSDLIFERWRSFCERDGYRRPLRSLFHLSPVRSAKHVCDYLAKSGYFEDNEDFAVLDATAQLSVDATCGNRFRDSATSPINNYVTFAGENPANQTKSGRRHKWRRVGLELARADLKDGRRAGRTPFQLARDYLADPVGNVRDLALWREFERESKGKRSIEWSRDTIRRADGSLSFQSFKARFGLVDKSDEELASDDVGGARVYSLTPAEWTIVRISGRILRLLEVTEKHGADGARFYVEYLRDEFAETGDLTGLDELDGLLEAAGAPGPDP